MPNLVGIYDYRARKLELERDVGRMMEAVDLPSFAFVRRFVEGSNVACGNVLPGMENNRSQPARNEDRTRWLMLDGEILAPDELVRSLRQKGVDAEGKDDAELALLCWQVFGDEFYEQLKGAWNLVAFDAVTGTTLVVTDRIGSRLLFYAEDGPRFVFGTEIKGVVAGRSVATKPGGVGLLQLMSSGSQHGDSTWLEGIRLFPPGTVLRLKEGQRRWHRYWKFRFREGGPEFSEDVYAEGFARRLKTATDRCMKLHDSYPIAITLSGGLDSRSIALSIDPSFLPITSITYGAPGTADVRYAQQLADLIGLDHHYIEPFWSDLARQSEEVYAHLASGGRGFLSAQLDRIAWRCEGLCPFDGLASTIWHPLYKKYMRFMLNGAAGDAMTGSHLTPNLLLGPSRSEVIDDLARRYHCVPQPLVSQVLNHDFYKRYSSELQSSFLAAFAEIDADEPFAVSNTWDMENRQRRGAFTSFSMERYFCTCRSPYLDYDLCDFLASVPGRWRFQQRIYKRMLVEHHARARHVPWAYTEGPITASPVFEFAREVYLFALRRAERLLPANRERPEAWDVRDTVKMLREERDLSTALESFTHSSAFPSDVFDAAGIRQFIADFQQDGGRDRALLFSQLSCVAKSIELFLAESPITIPKIADPAVFGVPTN